MALTSLLRRRPGRTPARQTIERPPHQAPPAPDATTDDTPLDVAPTPPAPEPALTADEARRILARHGIGGGLRAWRTPTGWLFCSPPPSTGGSHPGPPWIVTDDGEARPAF